MLDENEFYIVMKLTSGEQVMAVLKEEDDEHVLLESPMCIKTIPIVEQSREHVTAHPLCQFSDDRTFVIAKRDIMFVKKLHHLFVPHYQRIVAEHERISFVSKNKDGSVDELEYEDDLTQEEAVRRIAMLETLAKIPKDEEEESRYRVFVEGNDTVN
jgi:hypothetical protein